MDNVAPTPSAGSPEPLSKEQVSALVRDPELRRLPPGSEGHALRRATLLGRKEEESATSSQQTAEAKKTESGNQTPASGEPKKVEADDRAKWSKAAQKRIDEQTAALRKTEAERDELKRQLTERQGDKSAVETRRAETPKPQGNFDKPKPELKSFKNFVDYQEALTDWKIEKREFDRDQAANAQKGQTEYQADLANLFTKGKELEKELSLEPGDFEHAVKSEDLKIFPDAEYELLKSEHGARIAFEIASDAESVKAFSKMTQRQQIKLIGKLEAKFESQAKSRETEGKEVSKALPPATPLKRGSPSPATESSFFKKGMSVAEYEAKRRERRAALGRGGG